MSNDSGGSGPAPTGPAKTRHDEFFPIFFPPLPRARDDEDEEEDDEKDERDEQIEDETGEGTDRVPLIPWSDVDGDSDSWNSGDLPWGKADDDDPDDDDPDGPDGEIDDGNWDDLGWAGRPPANDDVTDGFVQPAMSSWQRRKSEPPPRTQSPSLRSGGVEPPPEELEELWARRRAEADAHREQMRLLREGRRTEKAKDSDDDEAEKETVPKSAELLQQADGVWGAGDDESGVIG